MQSVRKGNEMEKKSNKSNMFLAMLLAAASVPADMRSNRSPWSATATSRMKCSFLILVAATVLGLFIFAAFSRPESAVPAEAGDGGEPPEGGRGGFGQ